MKMSSPPSIQLLVMAVVQEQDIEHAISTCESFGALVIQHTSTGGFLGNRNGTLLIGIPTKLGNKLVESLQSTCHQRVEYLSMPVEGAPMPMPTSIPVTIGGTTIFAIPVEHFEEI